MWIHVLALLCKFILRIHIIGWLVVVNHAGRITLVLEISEGYRRSRRNTAIFCGISLAWAAAQFELKSLKIGAAGVVDISGASIPILLAFIIVYMLLRMTTEYMMQSKEVRRWELAQFDYKITLNLIRISFLALAVTVFSRSIESVVTAIILAVLLILGYLILVWLLMYIMMPLRMWVRLRQGKISAASSAIEATDLSMLVAAILFLGTFLYLGKTSFEFIPFISNSDTPLDTNSIIIFVTVSCLVILSWFFENPVLLKIFAFEPEYLVKETPLENGRIGVSFKKNPNHPDYVAPKKSDDDS